MRNSGATAVVRASATTAASTDRRVVVAAGTTAQLRSRHVGAGLVLDETRFVTPAPRAWPSRRWTREAENVRHLIEENAMRTDSPKAHELLDCWVGVMPKMSR